MILQQERSTQHADSRGASVEDAARLLLANHPQFRGRANLFEFHRRGDVLVVRGRAPTFYLKQLAQSVLKTLDGIRRIDNQIDVLSGEANNSPPEPSKYVAALAVERRVKPHAENWDEYLAELREQVCTHCIARRPDAPPCSPLGVGCGIEQHVGQLVRICREVDSSMIDPYLNQLRENICADCAFRDQPECPCPLKYLLPLAVSAVETVEQQRRQLGDRLAWPHDELPETD